MSGILFSELVRVPGESTLPPSPRKTATPVPKGMKEPEPAPLGATVPGVVLSFSEEPVWTAEVCRLALHLTSVPFTDAAFQPEGGAVVVAGVVDVDGKKLVQTSSMIRYCADLAGLTPSDPLASATVDEIIGHCSDLTAKLLPWADAYDEDEKSTLGAALEKDVLPKVFGLFEALLKENGSNGFLVGESMTVADLAVWKIVGWLMNEDNFPRLLGGFPFLSPVPKLSAHFKSIEKLPKIQEWMGRGHYALHAY